MLIKCLIVCSNELLGVSVEHLCRTQDDLDVHNAQFLVEADLIRELERYQPDVLIVDESIDVNYPTRLLQSLAVSPNVRVILLNGQANILHVYKKQDVLVTKASDLLSVVRDQPVHH